MSIATRSPLWACLHSSERRAPGLLLVLAGLCAMGCETQPGVLVVQLRTDYRPGIEFVTVETSSEGMAAVRTPAERGDDFLAGRRVRETPVSDGALRLEVRLLDASGGEVARRRAEISTREATVATVLISRRCRGVMCPGEGDSPSATECVGGACRPAECVDRAPLCGPAECSADAECAPPSCGVSRCIDGWCVGDADDTACDTGSYCALELGCLPLPGTERDDAGPTADAGAEGDSGGPDAGSRSDAGSLDAGVPDAGPSCLAGDAPIVSHVAGRARLAGGLVEAVPDTALAPPDPSLLPEGMGDVQGNDDALFFDGTAALASSLAEGQVLFDRLGRGSFTVEVWLETGASPRPQSVVELAGTFRLRHRGDFGGLEWQVGSSQGILPGVGAGRLVHAVGTVDVDAGLGQLRVDASGPTTVSISAAEWDRTVATYAVGGPSDPFDGQVYRATLYDRALDAAEIACLYERGPAYAP